MTQYKFYGLSCGSGTSYQQFVDGVYYGTIQPTCPPNDYFIALYPPPNEVWVNDVLISGGTISTEQSGSVYLIMGAIIALAGYIVLSKRK